MPDRTLLPSVNTRYHFSWSEEPGDTLVASSLDVEIDRSRRIKRISIAVCSDFPKDVYFYGTLEKCRSNVEIIDCS